MKKYNFRSLDSIKSKERVEIHFKFSELHKGYAEIAREHQLDNCDVLIIVEEVNSKRTNHNLNKMLKKSMKVVYRKRLVNKKPKYQKKSLTSMVSKFSNTKQHHTMGLALLGALGE